MCVCVFAFAGVCLFYRRDRSVPDLYCAEVCVCACVCLCVLWLLLRVNTKLVVQYIWGAVVPVCVVCISTYINHVQTCISTYVDAF